MLEDVVNSLITRFLGEYIKDIGKKDLKVSMWKGDVKLKNLEIKTEALDFLQLPVDIKSGFIGELNIRVPWKEIGRKPTRIEISNVYAVVCPRSEVQYDEDSFKQRVIELKRQRLKAIDEKETKKAKELNEKEDRSFVGKLVNKIIRNFEMTIKQVHLRYEDHSSDPKHPFCCGITLDSLLIPPNEAKSQSSKDSQDGEPSSKKVSHTGVFSKVILVNRFGAYWDSDNSQQVDTTDTTTLTNDMELAFIRRIGAKGPIPQNYVMHPCVIEVNVNMDIRGVELRKPTPDVAASQALKALEWNPTVIVNEKFVETYVLIRKDGTRGRSEDDEEQLFMAKFKEIHPKFCSIENLKYASMFARQCWKFANTASPMIAAEVKLLQFSITLADTQMRDLKILAANLNIQSKRAQIGIRRPTSSVVKKISFIFIYLHPRKWWRYAINCVIKENQQKRVSTSWEDYLEFKKQRDAYITLYKRVLKSPFLPSISKDKKALKQKQKLEDTFSVENTILFRKMAQIELNKELENHSPHLRESDDDDDKTLRTELYKELEINEEELNPWEGGQPMDIQMSVDLSIGSVQLMLKKQQQTLMSVGVDLVYARVYKRKEFLECWAMVHDLKVMDNITAKTKYSTIVSIRPRSTEDAVQSILPKDLYKRCAVPFVQAHVEIPALDNTSGMRVNATVETMDVVLNIPWLLEVMKFLVPENIVVMSIYEEKAYNLITNLRNGDANTMAAIQNNKGTEMNVSICPINLIIPNFCTGHRSKSTLLICQLGGLEVQSQPNKTETTDITQYKSEDLYNTMKIQIKDVSIGLVNGHVFSRRNVKTAAILSDYPSSMLILPFNLGVTMKTCIVNEVRHVSMRIGVAIPLIHVRITPTIISTLISWAYGIMPLFVEKQRELDIDVMKLLLQPKQLLFSCIAFDGSPYLSDHSIDDWKNSSSKQQRILYQVVQEYKQNTSTTTHPLSSVKSISVMSTNDVESMHGVVHLSFEDLLLLQYKPSMEIDVNMDEFLISMNSTEEESLVDVSMRNMGIHYLDHMYDMDIDVTIPSFNLYDHVREKSLIKQGITLNETPTLVSSTSESGTPFLKLKFCTVGDLSMLKERYKAATNVFAELGVVQIHANATALQPLLSVIPPIPPFPALPPAEEKAEPEPVAVSAHPQEAQMDMHVGIQSVALDLLCDNNMALMSASANGLNLVFTQATGQTHVAMDLNGVEITDLTQGADKYSEVMRTSGSPFLSADIKLVSSSLYDNVNDTTLQLHLSAPILTLRMRFVNELLEYLKHGSIARLMKPKAEVEEAVVSTEKKSMDSVASVHSLVDSMVNGIFNSIVKSNIIREVICENNETTYVLPVADVCIQNVVVLFPSSSSSDEGMRFELGEVRVQNSTADHLLMVSGYEKYLETVNRSALTTQLILSVHGMCLESQFKDDSSKELLHQSVLHHTDIDMAITLNSVLRIKINLTPVVVTLNYSQLDFLVHRLLLNLSEKAMVEYPEEETVEIIEVVDSTELKEPMSPMDSPVPDEPAEPSQPAKPTESTEPAEPAEPTNAEDVKEETSVVSPPALKLSRFFLDISMDGVVVELLRDKGGYLEGDGLNYGTNELSLVMLKLSGIYVNVYLTNSAIQLNLSLVSMRLCDTRSNLDLLPPFLEPIQLGDEHKAALSLACFIHDTNAIDVRGDLGMIRVFVAPLFMKLMDIKSEFFTVLSSTAESSEEIVLQPTATENPEVSQDTQASKEVSPLLASLLPQLHVRFTVSPICLYLASSFTSPSAIMLINIGMDFSAAFTSSFDVDLSFKLQDTRITQCSLENLLPKHDVNDMLQSWNCDMKVQLKQSFKDVVVTVEDKGSMIISVGYRDLLIATDCLKALSMDSRHSDTTLQPVNSDEPSSAFPVLKLPSIVPESLKMSISMNMHLHPLQITVVNDVSDVEVPFILLRMQDMQLSLDIKQQLVFLLTFALSVDSYNLLHVVWEPLLEPWDLMIQMVQRSGNEENRLKAHDPKSSVTIHADHVMSLMLSANFCATALRFMNDLSHYQGTTIFTDGYYMSVENKLDVPCTFEVVYDGGMSRQLELIRSQWSILDDRKEKLQIEGLLFVRSGDKVDMCWVELYQVEPRVRVYSACATAAGETRTLLKTSAEGSLKIEEDALFSCEMDKENMLFLSTNSQEVEAWRKALAATPVEVVKHSVDEVITIPAGGSQRTTLPAHPSLSMTNTLESYNQRIVSFRLGDCRHIEVCCDSEGDIPFSIYSQTGEYCYDIIVRVINRNGLRVMMLTPLLMVTNYSSSPIQCDFSEQVNESDTLTVHQSQRKQVNLVETTNNYFGSPISVKNTYFDSVSHGVAVHHGIWNEEKEGLSQKESKYSPLHMEMKNRVALGYQNKYCSISMEDIASLNFRRFCMNLGDLLDPHYVLVRSMVRTVESDSLKMLPIPPAPKSKNDILEKLNSQMVNGVVGNVGNHRSVFEIAVVPVMVLKNLLPISLEYRVLMKSKGIVLSGTVESGKSVEMSCIDGESMNLYGIQLRPTGNQFVWNQALLPIMTEGSGDYDLSDIENSHSSLRYLYSFEQDGSVSSQYLVLSIYSPFWVVNRTPSLLFLSGKTNSSTMIRLPPATIEMGFEGSISTEGAESLKPALFSGDEKKAVIRVRRENSEWSEKSKVKEGATVVKIPAQSTFLPMETIYTVVVRRLNAPFTHTKLMTILPRYVMINRTSFGMALYQNTELLTVAAHSCVSFSSLYPAPRHLLSFSILGDNTPTASPVAQSDVKSAQFDLDAVGQWDVILSETSEMDVIANSSSLFSLSAAEINGQQTITIERLKPENVSLCVSNNSALDRVKVLQMSSDISSALSVSPLDSQFYVLPHPAGPNVVVLFFQQIDMPPQRDAFVPCVAVDLTNLGKVTTVERKNPSRFLEVSVEVEDTTRIIIIREKPAENEWKQRKQFEFTRVVLEESITRIQFEHDDLQQKVTDFTAALSAFEEHAMQASTSSELPKQPVFMAPKSSNSTMDLMLNDEYYWLNIRNISIRNLQRKPCSIVARVSNGETMLETKSKQGSHVYVDEEIILRQRSSVLQVKVSVTFEKGVVEFNTFIEYAAASEFNSVKLLQIPFQEVSDLCDGGCLYVYLIHCKNNKINNDEKEYLPHLLKSLFDSEKELTMLKESRNCLDFELYLNSSKHSALLGHPMLHSLRQNKDELLSRVSNIHIQRALRKGFYQDFKPDRVQEIVHSSDEETSEMEHEQSLVVEVNQWKNVPVTDRPLHARVRCGEKAVICGEMGVSKAPQVSTSAQVSLVFREVRIGCKMFMDDRGQIIVASVEKGSEADRYGVCAGMTLWGVNDGSVEGLIDVNRKLKSLPRPLKLVFVAPYRSPTKRYSDVSWKGRAVLPSGSTAGQSQVILELMDGDEVVSTHPIRIRRFNDWEGNIGGSESTITSVEAKVRWESKARELDLNTMWSIAFAGMDMCVMDATPTEVINLGVRGISLDVNCYENDEQRIGVMVNRFQVDNQLLNAMEPVLLGQMTQEPTLRVSVIIPTHPLVLFFEKLHLQLQSFFVALDNRLLVAMLRLVTSIPMHLLGNSSSGNPLEDSEFKSVMVIPTNTKSTNRVVLEDLQIDDFTIAVSNKVDPATTVTGVFLPSIPSLIPLQTILDTLCGLVADIDATKINLTGIHLSEFVGSMNDLVKVVSAHYVPIATKQALKIFGSINLLGNPVGLVEDVGSGLKAFFVDPMADDNIDEEERNRRVQQGGKILVRNTTKGVMNTASKITGTLGNGVASLTFNKHYKEQRVLGRRGLIHGIASGVTGVVMDPIRGAKKSGVRGAMEGVGMGLIGVVTKPISGLLDDTSRLLDNAKEVIANEKRPERLRLPHCILCDGVIRSFDPHAATGQMLFFTSTTRYLVERGEKEQYVLHCIVDNGTHYLVVTQYHCFLLSPEADLLWYLPLHNLNIEVEEQEMRLVGGGESKLVLFLDKDICSRMYGILINMENWTNKEIVQCSKDFVNFVASRYKDEVELAYSTPAIDFKMLDMQSVCMISVDVRYERKMAASYSVKANSYQEYCLEVVGGVEETAMASWRVYRRYSELRAFYKQIEGKLPKQLKAVKFPGKKMQILGSHLNSSALKEREVQMQAWINDCMCSPIVLQMPETREFLITDPVNVKYEV